MLKSRDMMRDKNREGPGPWGVYSHGEWRQIICFLLKNHTNICAKNSQISDDSDEDYRGEIRYGKRTPKAGNITQWALQSSGILEGALE